MCAVLIFFFFLQVLDTFNLSHALARPTHNRGHTLDLVLCYGIMISDAVCQESVVSDQKGFLFNTYVQNTVNNNTVLFYSYIFNSVSTAKFYVALTHLWILMMLLPFLVQHVIISWTLWLLLQPDSSKRHLSTGLLIKSDHFRSCVAEMNGSVGLLNSM